MVKMPAITEIFEGIKTLLMVPAEFYVRIEGQAGTKAIIATTVIGTYCGAMLLGIKVPPEFGSLALAAGSMYITFSATKYIPSK